VADALEVTLDNLVKDGQYQNIDRDALNRLKLIEKLCRMNAHISLLLWMLSLLNIGCKAC
jgi:hypothetical protein